MDKIIWILIAFLSGAILPIQAGFNTKLGKSAGNPVYASLISFIVGMAVLSLYIMLTQQSFSWKGLREAPAYAWTGGILGAIYVTVIIFAYPRIGPGLTFGLVVAGQVLIALLLEHFNLMVSQAHQLSPGRIAGLLLIIAGIIIIEKF